MRVDLTICSRSGDRHDVAVMARTATRLADLRDAAPHLLDGDIWNGDRRLADDTELGSTALCNGSVLTIGRPGPCDPGAGAAPQLAVVGGPGSGLMYPLTRGVVTLGRAPDCDLVLPDPDVSRRHAEVAVTAQGVVVRDLASTNGVRVDNEFVGPSGAPLRPRALLRLGDSFVTVSAAGEVAATLRPGPDGLRLVNRPPRLRGRPVTHEITLPQRESAGRPQRVPWLTALLPAAVGVALALAMRSAQFLAFALLSPAVVLGSALGDRAHWRRDRRRASAAFRRRTAEAHGQIAAALADETAVRRGQHPDPPTVRRIAAAPSARLWERALEDDDALTVRLGLSRLAAGLVVRTGDVVEPAGLLEAVPIVADLRAGPLGIVAPPGLGTGLARWVVGQLATLHAPADLEIALLLSSPAAPQWTWTRWLPHVRGRIAVTAAQRRSLVSDLVQSVERRQDGSTRPWLVIVVDRAADASDVPSLGAVLSAGAAARITAVCVGTQLQHLPTACTTLVQPCGETGTRLRLRTRGATSRTDTDCEAVADVVSQGWADAVARSLAPLAEVGGSGRTVPDACRLLELLHLDELDPASVSERWAGNDGGAATVIGLGADGPVALDLVRDGPHALVGGTTGAGKSELLQSIIVGLAATYPPDELSFVLVDYKGGAAFAECARLPHTTGLVTDLDPHLTARALRSLDAELRRREGLLAGAGASGLLQYRAGGPAEPLARLVIVVDEFATLAEELPDFVSGLVGIAQRGRSLGIHLVLATQRPGGAVSPEIRANTSLRIALRVTGATESVDIVGCDAAARIDRRLPGRAVVRAGPVLTQLQVARIGGPAHLATPSSGLRVEALDGWRRLQEPAPDDADADADARSDLRLLVDCISEAAARSGRGRLRRPWLPPLPHYLPASQLGADRRDTSIRIGLLDLPASQSQPPLALDLAAGGSLLLAGGPRSGRSTALVSIALAAAVRLPPERLHIHAIDFGGTLDLLRSLPHCGTVAGRDDADLIAILLGRLEREVACRQRVLADQRVASITDTWAADDALPLILVLLDGWDVFLAASDEHDLGRSTERFLGLLRGAASAGITVVIAGDRGALAPRLAGAVTSRLLLRPADRADFTLAGIPARTVPNAMPPGRAVRVDDGAEVQFAHPGRAPTRDEQRLAAAEASAPWQSPDPATGRRDATVPIRVRPLPTRVDLRGLPARVGRIVLGLAGDEAVPVTIDPFAGAARLLVAGPTRSGRTTVLRSALSQARASGVPVVVAAPRRSPLCDDAARARVPVLGPDTAADAAAAAIGPTLLLVDDGELFLDTPVGDALSAMSRTRTDLAVIAAGRTDDLLLAFRGLAAEMRRARCCLLLQPGPGDGELVGQRLPRQRSPGLPGRGLLVGDPAWGAEFTDGPLRIQVALP